MSTERIVGYSQVGRSSLGSSRLSLLSEATIAAMNSLERKSLAILWSALLAFVILAIGQGVWTILLGREL